MKGLKFKRPFKTSQRPLCGIVRVKAHPKRRQLHEHYRATMIENSTLASQIDIKQLIMDRKIPYLDVDSNGVAKVDYSNPIHQKWLED